MRITEAGLSVLVARTCLLGQCRGPADIGWLHLNTIYWTGGDTELTAGTVIRDDGMHELVGADDGVHGAGLYAQGAAYAVGLINHSDQYGPETAALRIKVSDGLPCELGEFFYPLGAAGWATIRSEERRVGKAGSSTRGA